MNDLKINFEWIDPGGARGPELRATWARLEVLIDDEPLIRPLDNVSKTVRDSVFLPLYPLAEWLVTHWWFLLNEIETPGRANEESYALRHDLRYASEGFAIPSALIRPLGNTVRIDWSPKEFPHQRIEFVGHGTAHIPSENFANVISGFISSVVSRLVDLGISNTLLQEEWITISETALEEREFCEASAALGLDPYSLDEQSASAIVEVGNLLPVSLVGEFFSAADFPSLSEQLSGVLKALELSRSNPANLESLKDLREATQAESSTLGAPWEQGYQVARQLRQRLNLPKNI